jgi:hypothetical protein
VLLPWYAAWVMPMAWILPRTARGSAVLLSMALAITELVAEPSRSPDVYEAMVFGLHWVATPAVLLILIRLLLDLRRRLRAGPVDGADDPLIAEDVPSPADLTTARGREQVPDPGERQDDHRRGRAGRKEPQALRRHGAGDRDADPH